MQTIADNEVLTEAAKMATLKNAKLGAWYDGWRPYCFAEISSGQYACSNPRMRQTSYGFHCPECGNMIGWNLVRLAESPLNMHRQLD